MDSSSYHRERLQAGATMVPYSVSCATSLPALRPQYIRYLPSYLFSCSRLGYLRLSLEITYSSHLPVPVLASLRGSYATSVACHAAPPIPTPNSDSESKGKDGGPTGTLSRIRPHHSRRVHSESVNLIVLTPHRRCAHSLVLESHPLFAANDHRSLGHTSSLS